MKCAEARRRVAGSAGGVEDEAVSIRADAARVWAGARTQNRGAPQKRENALGAGAKLSHTQGDLQAEWGARQGDAQGAGGAQCREGAFHDRTRQVSPTRKGKSGLPPHLNRHTFLFFYFKNLNSKLNYFYFLF